MITRAFFTLVFLASLRAASQTPDLTRYVNTLQGTNSSFELTRGNTYPTTALPFGMHTWTPQTGINGDGWKYQYAKDEIRGFQQAHQCSSWTNDYCVFSLMPETGELVTDNKKRGAKFSHANESGRPEQYKVRFDNGIETAFSPTERGAHLRFSFPKGKSFLVLDGYTGMSAVKIDAQNRRITGWVRNGRGLPENLKSYFVLEFDKPFRSFGTWKDDAREAGKTEAEGKSVGAYLEFADGEKVQVKTASSYISPEQAQLNLSRELGRFKSVDEAQAAAKKIWDKHLGRILVEGGSDEDKTTFYSCFFRASLFSRQFFEYDKNNKPYYFSPYDGKVHSGYMFTDTGFWDTFRAQFPLNALLHPTMHGRYMQALLAAQEQCGWLPSWSFPGEGGSMIGNHAISLLADAWVKGIRTFDPKKALEAYRHESTQKGPWGPANGRGEWKDYREKGYAPYPEYREATAKTLEYAYDDFCGYTLAKNVGEKGYADEFGKYMYNYKNVYDPGTRFMRAKDRAGKWGDNFDPTEWGGPFTEGNAWHWQWSVFHDISGLIHLMGGEKNFTAKLDSVFTQPNTVNVGTYGNMIHEMTEMVMANMGQYAHGNQPIQHMTYLYNYAGEPWKSQYHVRNVMKKLYSGTEDGYPGDEDQGQTSSWYVLSAMGFYSVCPGTDEYVLGSPAFKKITITMEEGKKFVINAKNNSATNVYIKSAKLNGRSYDKTLLHYADLVKGGTFDLQMSAQPDKRRGTRVQDRPFSVSAERR
ncbi:MAG: GH92 family glycosyl hydrolase [Mucilaginibacter polytrichastri]|nr:GH92 family glycosyl hydrolase [Mucilaginibacter polytrichastri]